MFNSQHKKVSLLLDIGNGSVAVALVLSPGDGTSPVIVRSVREALAPETKPTGANLQIALLDKLATAFTELIRQEKAIAQQPHAPYRDVLLKHATDILCTLSSPWFFSKALTVSISQAETHNKVFVMTERFLADVLNKEVDVFTREIGTADDLKIVEKTILGATVNGYHVLNPLHQKTDACDIYIYMSAGNTHFIEQIIKTVGKFSHLSHEHIRFHSFPLVAFSVIRDIFPAIQEYLLFDIAGEITDIAWVCGGIIMKTVSYPCGTHILARGIAKHFDVPYEVARSYLRLFLEARATKQMSDDIRALLIENDKEFNAYLAEALKTLSPDLTLPYQVFVSTYPHARDLFEEFLKQDIEDDLSHWKTSLSITHLEDSLLLESTFWGKF